MYINKAQANVKQAEDLLLSAQNELFKSKDDIVLLTACSNSRQSIQKFLTAYLMKNGFHSELNESISNLLKHCIEIDPRFANIKIDEMHCSTDKKDNRYCTDVKKIQECVDIAVQTQKLLDFTSDHWPISKHVK